MKHTQESDNDPGPGNPAQVLRGSAEAESSDVRDTITPKRETKDPCRLSFAQERLWFLDQLESQTAAYNIPSHMRLCGDLHVGAIEKALNTIVARHEALRTTFICKDGVPLQVIGTADGFKMNTVDLSFLTSEKQYSQLRNIVETETLQPFNLATDLMIRATLVRMTAREHILLLTLHHIASDGWSISVLYRELSTLYRAYRSGTSPQVAELPIQYADFALWQREWLKDGILEEQASYWKQKLAGSLEFEHLVLDRPRPARRTHTAADEVLYLSPNLEEKLKRLSQTEHCSLFMVLLAGFQLLLHRYSGHKHVQVGSPIANRTRVEVEELIGFFVNTIVLQADFRGDPSFCELLRRVRETALEAYDNQDLPFEKLVESLHPERTLSHTPLFQVMFSFENMPSSLLDMPGLTTERVEIECPVAKFDVTLTIEVRDALRVSARYNTDLFDRQTIQRMLYHYEALLQAAVADSACRVDELPMLSEAERRQLVVEWNDTQRAYPDACVHHLFESQAHALPGSPALLYAGGRLSYGELDQKANQLAHQLLALGVGPEVRVGICLERSPEFIIAALATLKAGGAYVPLDPGYPRERLAFMAEDANAEVLIATTASVQKLPPREFKVICMDLLADQLCNEDCSAPTAAVTADSLAYIMYTSGSTGRPRGVEILHRGIVRLLVGVDYVQLGKDEAVLQMAPTSFDASTFEIWGALLHGSPLVLYPHQVPTAGELSDVIREYGVRTMWLTSSLFNAIIDEDPQALRPIRQLLIGGEALSVPHVQRAIAALPDTQIINGYGPTESTTFACCYRIPIGWNETVTSVPIGRPIANTTVHILNSSMQPVPIGAVGELWVGGDGVARGYVNAPELNREKFVPDPFSSQSSHRLYRTGDLARYRADGLIEFRGRADDQVKIRGFRIELGEVESTLAQHAGIKAAVVTVRVDVSSERTLVAYVVPREGQVLAAGSVMSFLKLKLPSHLVPGRIVFLQELPRSPNGKIDRRALPPPQLAPGIDQPVVPRDAVEAKLLKIWETVLPNREIGVTDNFFDLGGHSLLASKLLARIQRGFGQKLSMASLFQSPTIEQQAALLRDSQPIEPPLVIPIQPRGSKPVFFCIGGGPLQRPLASRLDDDQPFVGLGLESADLAGLLPPYRVKDIAQHLVSKLRRIQPTGPYYLGGWCLDGLLAYEVAQQMRAAGQEVPIVVMFEAPNPAGSPSMSAFQSLAGHLRLWKNAFLSHMRDISHLTNSARSAYVVECLSEFWEKARRFRWRASYHLNMRWMNGRSDGALKADRLLYLASRDYDPTSYSGYVLLFQCESRPNASDRDLRRAWEHLIEQLEFHEVPGDHSTMFLEPNVEIMAKILSKCLTRAHLQASLRRQPAQAG